MCAAASCSYDCACLLCVQSLMLAHHVKNGDETILQAFERIDVNGDGILSREELEDRSSCTPRVVDEIFARCQKRDDGCIDLNDLRKLVWLDEEIARLRLQLATADSFMVTVKTLVGHAHAYEVQGKSTITCPPLSHKASTVTTRAASPLPSFESSLLSHRSRPL